jgi:multidrug efflux pump subunit AcrA (membrane-fusion protein)
MLHEPIALDAADATLRLLQASQRAGDTAARRFVLLNRTREAWPYQIAVLREEGAVAGHSGVGQLDAQGPYGQWLGRLVKALDTRPAGPLALEEVGSLAEEGAQYWPSHLLWLPHAPGSALLLARDLPWSLREAEQLERWWQSWRHDDAQAGLAASAGRHRPLSMRWRERWKGRRMRQAALAVAALLLVLGWPVHLTLRAPGELVPRHPVAVRTAIDGTVRSLEVEPNQPVKAGQVLAELDGASWQARLQVARHALATAEAEWRQVNQQLLNDPRARSQLAAAQGRYEEKRAEANYLAQQVQRTTLVAPRDGVVLIQDPGSWPGRTVATGETIMKLAQPEDQELEAWLAVGDAVDLAPGTPMTLHLASRPGQPVTARLQLYAFEAEQRPDLGLGYRLRGTLDAAPTERLGARGTVRIDGPRVPLLYWLMRRPLAALREATGW